MEDRELTFWEHLDVLRWALVRIVCLWFVLAIGFFIAMPYIFDPVIMGPCHDDFVFYGFLRKIGEVFNLTGDFFTQRFDIKLQNINLAAPFFVHLTTSFVLSIIILVPYIFWEIWLFISPALYPNEAKGVRKALLLGNVMFYVGMAVGYFMVYPLALRFLATYDLSDNIDTLISLNSYIDNFMMLVLAMGVAFELPLVTWLLSLFGLLTRSTLREYRRHAIVVIVIAAAIITPTGDPFTLTAVALPLYALYELSIFMIKEQKEEEEDEDDADESPTGSGGDSNGPKPASEKKPDGGNPVAPAAEAKTVKPEKMDLKETFRLQREAAEQAKVEAKNKALQERLDKAAAATGVAVAGGAEGAEAATTEGAVKELTANTDPSVKDALAEAASETKVVKKKKIREPRMVIVNDEIFWEDGPEIEVDDVEEPASDQEQQAEELPAEEPKQTEEMSSDEKPAEQLTAEEKPNAEELPEEKSESLPADEEPADQPSSSASSAEATSETPAEVPSSPEVKLSPEEEASQVTINKPEALNTPYYDDPEAMPDLSNYYAETHRERAEEEAAEALANSNSFSLSTPSTPSSDSIVEQARLAAENARKAAEEALKAAQEAARIAEETAKAAEAAAKAAADQAAKVAEEAAKAAAKPAIDVSGIRYDYGRFNQ